MTTEVRSRRSAARAAAVLFGVAFLLVGVLGFIPGITAGYRDLHFAGHESGARLFGVFTVSVLHNLVHLAFGVLGLVAARGNGGARAFLMLGGGVYVLLWVFGLALNHDSPANFIPVDNADDWLHLALGVAMIAAGIATTAIDRARGRYPEPEIQGH
jgi:arginine exporter protein ArgO